MRVFNTLASYFHKFSFQYLKDYLMTKSDNKVMYCLHTPYPPFLPPNTRIKWLINGRVER